MRFALIASALAVYLAPPVARACKPAPNHTTTIAGDTSPACVAVTAGQAYDEAIVRVENQCPEAVELKGVGCASCDPAAVVAPGEQLDWTVEHRQQASTATIEWAMSQASGEITVEVAWQDNSDACDRFVPYGNPTRGVVTTSRQDEGTGGVVSCRVGDDRPSDSWFGLIAFTFIFGIRVRASRQDQGAKR